MVETMTDWAIPQQAKLKYTQLFNIHDRSRSGFLSGLQCRDILLQSGLARNILAEIWNLSDIDGDGQLTREEFILAMHLTNQIRAGHCLPKELPADLVPPSYRRTRSISGASVQSVTSSTSGGGIVASAPVTNDKAPQGQPEAPSAAAGSVLNSNSFEDKRRENYERGRAELERRRLKIIEQQTSVLSEQLASVKKQVAEAKAKIDVMRAERDTKAGLTTSLEAQLKTVRDRKVYLDHEELSLIAIAKDLNLVNSVQSPELDEQAIKSKQESIEQMRGQLIELQNEKENKSKELEDANSRSEELKKELRSVCEAATKLYGKYKEKIAEVKVVQAQLAEENNSKTVNLDSVWDSTPNFGGKTQPDISTSGFGDDSWAPTSSPKPSNDQPFSFSSAPATSDSNEKSLEQPRDYSALTTFSSNLDDFTTTNKTQEKKSSLDLFQRQGKKCYRALYAFEARNPDELTINPGDIIIGTEEVCEPGWLSGESNGKSGLFPEAYVELLEQGEQITDAQTSPGIQETQPVDNEGLSPAQTTPNLPNVVNATRYKAIYSFEARNHDELNLTPGDIITGLDEVSEPGWLMGELNGLRGLFPEAYVEKIVEAIPSAEMGGKSRTKRAEVATAIANYRALGQEQLNLEKGQLVQIRRKMDSGWWEGEIQVKDNLDSTIPQLVSANFERQGDEFGKGNELVHLIKELVESELDYATDLRLFRDAYIEPLSVSFDVGPIFKNWHRIIEVHESSLKRLSTNGTLNIEHMNLDPKSVMQTFKELLENIVDLYIEFCPSQNESTRLIETKVASDIRFKQLINESQRWLKKILEQNEGIFDSNSSSSIDASTRSRALRNAKLPLTSFLIKPMQRITKYSLIFGRLVKVANETNDNNLKLKISCLNDLAQLLCTRVNETCRLKEDEENNNRKLRWSQSHIKQSVDSNELRHFSAADSIVSSSSSTTDTNSSEKIDFCSKTKYLGMRRFIKAGSVQKLKSGRELILFLYNDFLLITQTKGGVSIRVADVFKSERAQQTYYKIYKQPILLEDLTIRDNVNSAANIIQSEGFSSQHSLNISDKSTGISYDLICMDPNEHSKWKSELIERSRQAYDAHAKSLNLKLSRLSLRPTIDSCFARLFITLLELRWAGQTRLDSSSALYNSLNSRTYQMNHVQKVRVEVQLCRHENSRLIKIDGNEKLGESITALSDLFKTKRVSIDRSNYERLQFSVDSSDGNDNRDTDWNSLHLDEESTQFLIPSNTTDSDFIEIELIEDSRFKVTHTLACKKLSLNRMLGREVGTLNSHSTRRSSMRNQIEKLEPNRPMECTFKLKPSVTNEVFPKVSNITSDREPFLRGDYELRYLKWSIRLRLHLQLFCDNDLI